jgi:predicted patatin/cPLA2 family phospholipase
MASLTIEPAASARRIDRTRLPDSTPVTHIGDLRVLKNMYEASLQKPQVGKSKCAIILPGGGQQGAFEAGVLARLLEGGFLHGVESIAGVSTGAIVGAYAATGDIKAARIFHRNVQNGLFRYTPSRLHRGIVDLTSLEHELRTHTPLDVDALRRSPIRLLVGLTEFETAEGRFVEINHVDDPVTFLLASACIPRVSDRKRIAIDGKYYLDGSIAAEFPVDLRSGITDFLIIMPWNPDYTNPLKEFITHLGEHILAVGLHEPLKSEIISHRRKNRIVYEQVFRSGYMESAYGVNVLIIHPTKTLISVTSMDHVQIQQGMSHAYHYTDLLIDAMMESFS